VIADFLDAISTGREPETVNHDNIKSLAMVLGAIESAKSGQSVDISA
jgi:predicted dehydrogenase